MKISRTRRTRPGRQEQPQEVQQALQLIAKEEPKPVEKSKAQRAEDTRIDYDQIILKYREKATNRKGAIRAKCVECVGGYIAEVARCSCPDCALYPFRMGESPFDKRTIRAKEKRGEQ